jgi:CMP/dCMP kinase
MPRVVTIDGPAGAGKSSVARRLAGRLGWRFLDTGAMYRVVTLAALRSRADLASDHDLGKLSADVEVSWREGQVLLGREDVTAAIRGVEVTAASRFVADSPSVRRLLVHWQRAFAAQADTVTEGRDQGTFVFPNAFRKFFLTAAAEERARRRLADLEASGQSSSFESVLEDLRVRDARDVARSIAPLRPADDAVLIDTTGLSIDQVVEQLIERITATDPPDLPFRALRALLGTNAEPLLP